MAGHGAKPGSNNGGGRKAGTPNKATVERLAMVQQAVSKGITPLEFMLSVLHAPGPTQIVDEPPSEFLARCKAHQATQMDAAKAAAPYIHPKLQTTEVKTPEPLKVQLDIVDLAKRIAFMFALAEGKS